MWDLGRGAVLGGGFEPGGAGGGVDGAGGGRGSFCLGGHGEVWISLMFDEVEEMGSQGTLVLAKLRGRDSPQVHLELEHQRCVKDDYLVNYFKTDVTRGLQSL